MNIFLTGVSRGIGLELARQGLENGHRVLATARNPDDSLELSKLRSQFEKSLNVHALDVTDHRLELALEKIVGGLSSIDVLINNAGVYKDGCANDDFIQSFRTNSIAPFLVTKTLTPLLKKSKKPTAVHITSKMGSIADNAQGGVYAYRASKAALNMINKSLSLDEKWLTTIVIHPGWVKTDMGGKNAPTEVRDSASGIWNVIGSLSLADSGKFYDFKGQNITW